MADFNSSLPVRTEAPGDVEIKLVDGTITSRKLTVNADGSINTNTTLSATDLDIRDLVFATDKVDVTGSEVSLDATTLAALENITVSATDLDIRDLAFATDSVDVSGSSVTVTATDLDIRDLNSATDSVTVVASDLDVRDLVFATDKVDVTGSSVTVSATDLDIRDLSSATDSVTVLATDLDIRDLSHTADSIRIGDGTDFLAVNADGSINVVPQEDAGTEQVDFSTAASVAGGGTSNHDFVVTNGGMLYQVQSSASGKLKAEVQIETGSSTGVFNTVMVGFNSTANPNIDLMFAKYATIPSGARVRVIRTNRDNQAQDVYSTIILIENL